MAGDSNSAARLEKGGPLPKGRSRVRKIGRWSLVGLVFSTFLAIGVFIWAIGQTLTVPDWVRAKIETRIEQSLEGLQITFGDVELVVNKGWRPRVRLRDVTLSGKDGLPIVQLTDAQISLAMRPLFKGLVQPKRIALTGAFATLRRDSEGNLSLALSDNAAPVERASNLPNLIEEWDQLFALPALSALVQVEMEALTLRYEDAQKNRAWTLDGGHLLLDRDDDLLRLSSGFTLLGGADYASSIEMNYTSLIGNTEAEFGFSVQDIQAQDIAAQNVALSWLGVLRAPISGALRGSVDETGALGPLSATLQIGSGVLQPNDATIPVPFSGAHSYFTYQPDEQVLVFDDVFVSSGWGTGSMEGRAYLNGVESGTLTDLIGQVTLSDVTLNPNELYETPLQLSESTADFRLELVPFKLNLGQLYITEQQNQFFLSGELAADDRGWSLALDGNTDAVTPERLLALWPEMAVPKPRKWVAGNLLGGLLHDIDFALRVKPGERPDVYLDFDYENATIQFLPTLPPITKADGQASLLKGRFVATATSGEIIADEGGPVDVSGTSFIIPDVAVKPKTHALVRVLGEGSVTSVMSLLNRPPLAVLKGTPFPVDLANGKARVEGTLALPLKPKIQFDEFEFHLAGQVDDVSSSVLVPGYVVKAPKLNLTGDHTQIVLSGRGQIEELPAEVRWRQPLGKGIGKASRLEGVVEISPRLIETFSIGLPNDSVSGEGKGTFSIDLGPGEPPALVLKSDLKGVGLSLPPLGWAKPAAATGLLEVAGTLGAQTRIDRLVLQAAGLAATGTVVNRPGGGLERALLSSVRLNNWLDATVELVGRGEASPDMRILSGTLDMRKTSFDSGGSSGTAAQPGGLQVALNRLQVTDTLSLSDFTGNFRTAGGLDGSFKGRVNGGTEVTGQIVPQAGRSAVRVKSNNAGGVIRDAGLLTKAQGGSFDMVLVPAKGEGQFDGTLRVTNTKVKDAPAIAALLNSISVVGLFDELSGQGIQFAEVDAKFRLGPSKVTVFKSSATGPSIGLSMDGNYDVPTGSLRMQGVISPVYLLNQIGNLVARKGEGVIGFNYTLTGSAESPSVQVNPLSALTPGILRDIMRTSPPPIDEENPQEPKKTPHIRPDDAHSGR